MLYAMSRDDYDAMFGTGVGGRYPLNSGGAIVELRLRGLDASKPRLDYLLLKGQIAEPLRVGVAGNWKWQSDRIDEAAEVFDKTHLFTPQAVSWAARHVRLAQAIQALRDAHAIWPHVDSDLFILSVYPCGDIGPAGGSPAYSGFPYNLVTYYLDEEYLKMLAARDGPLRKRAADCLKRCADRDNRGKRPATKGLVAVPGSRMMAGVGV